MRKDADGFAERVGIPLELRPVVAALQRFNAATTRRSMELWLQLDLTMTQFVALYAIWQMGPISGRQLAAHLGITAPAVVKLCDRLETEGFIQRSRDTADRRVQWVQLTSRGTRVFQQLVALKRAQLMRPLKNLTPADREILTNTLNQLADQIDR